ncbi:PD40 domain-containing protein [Conexibacter sp. W3-3-2]|uniref:PD40 domain-containing protein n=1 Tax=Conexibacter sp. W3-3-2 TaxID=2675227 RepID=UPI0018AB88EB|nr:PD40 domain-containing protein [Conexibacter sp. W3-3-2]
MAFRHRAAPAAVAALALSALGAPAAHADSIAYIKDADVWLSTADGSRQHRVTTTGGYADVSQADDGTMIALHGVRLRRLDREGRVLADFDTPVSDTRPPGSKVFWGPFDPALSPDGSKVAYTWFYTTQTQNPNCYPPECTVAVNEGGTGYSRADRQTSWDEPGFRKHSGWRNPIWADDATTVLTDPTHLPNADVVVDQPGSRTEAAFLVQNWFTDQLGGNPGVGAGDLTRAKDKLALVTGQDGTTLTVYRVGRFPTTFKDGEAPADSRPDVCYRYGDAVGGRFRGPTFSPDGARLAFAAGDGIHVVDVPSFAAGCTQTGASLSRLLIPGGSEPDWGPADVPLPSPPAGGNGAAGGTGGGAVGAPGPVPAPSRPAAVALRVAGTGLRQALRRGLVVRVTRTTPGARVTLRALQGRRTVAIGSGRASAAGALTVRLRFTRAAARRLSRMRRVPLTVAGADVSTTVVLRR